MPDQSSPAWVPLISPELTVEINPLGAQLSVLRDSDGRDLLWNGEPSVWAGRAPILFPIVGSLAEGRYRIGATTYQLPRHGFARGKLFEVTEARPAKAVFRLKPDSETLKVYPFQFELDVSFALNGSTLSVVSTVRSRDRVPMPASVGYHPAFRWPLPYGSERAIHYIEFAQEEDPSIRRLDGAGLLTAVRHPTPISNRRLLLDDALFRDDVVILNDMRSHSLTYGGDKGARIQVSYPDASFLGLWTKPGAGFICIEPWQGIADEVGFTGEFAQRLGVFTLAPGAERALSMDISLLR
jgi:galactose mutarotase-like enzyme